MTPASWPCPLPGSAATSEEHALAFDRARSLRLLIVPALFDEANRMRRFTVEVMRRLDGAGIDSFLPDLPGTNESLAPLAEQTPENWRAAIAAACVHFRASHVLGIRGGCLLTPDALPGWHYGAVKGASILRQLIRSRIVASREAGIEETTEGLSRIAAQDGIELAGYRLGAALFNELEALEPSPESQCKGVAQADLGGSPLWLRAEPDEDADQADALAAIIAIGIKA